jgi:hypothetical protein
MATAVTVGSAVAFSCTELGKALARHAAKRADFRSDDRAGSEEDNGGRKESVGMVTVDDGRTVFHTYTVIAILTGCIVIFLVCKLPPLAPLLHTALLPASVAPVGALLRWQMARFNPTARGASNESVSAIQFMSVQSYGHAFTR